MKGADLTPKQLKAAEQYVLLRRADHNISLPNPEQMVTVRWKQLIMLVAEYGAIRAIGMENGGSVNDPGEVFFTGKEG